MYEASDGLPTLNFNVFKGLGYCHYCKANFNTVGLISELGLRDKLLVPPKSFSRSEGLSVGRDEAPPVIDQSLLWRPIRGNSSYLAKRALDYLTARGVTEWMIEKYGFGIGKEGKLYGRIILPVYRDGKLVYYQARAIEGEPKYLNPPLSHNCLGKSEVVGYLDLVKPGDPIAITEGLFSAIGATEITGYQGVAVLGKTVSDSQLMQIVTKEPGKCLLMLDSDVPSSSVRAEARKLRAWGLDVDIHWSPDGDPWDAYRRETKLRASRLYECRGNRAVL
jgi:hypothetical protein